MLCYSPFHTFRKYAYMNRKTLTNALDSQHVRTFPMYKKKKSSVSPTPLLIPYLRDNFFFARFLPGIEQGQALVAQES